MQIIDNVKPRTVEDYQATTQAEVERLQALPEVIAVYSTGMVKAPGISDLDIIAVIDHDHAHGRVGYRLRKAMKIPVEGYIRTHPIFAISRQHFPKVRWIADLSTLDCLTGEQIDVDSIDATDQDLLRAITTLEIGVHKLFALRAVVLGEGLTTRNLLLTLNSIGYSLHLADQLRPCSQTLSARIKEFRDELLKLRSTWFKQEEKARLAKLTQLLELAPKLLVEAMNVASTFLLQECQLETEQKTGLGTLQVNPRGYVSFDLSQPKCDAYWGNSTFLQWSTQFKEQVGEGLQGPIGLAIPFAFYRSRLPEGSRQRHFFDAMVQMDNRLLAWALGAASPIRERLIHRAEMMCEYADWYRPFWTSSVCFSVFTPWLMGERSPLNKVWARLEPKVLAMIP